MNKVTLIGRLTKDVDSRILGGDNSVHNFSLAVPRQGKKDEVDFIQCVAWNKAGEIIGTYAKKGSKLAITGSIQTGGYTKDGIKHYTTQVAVDGFEFCDSKPKE